LSRLKKIATTRQKRKKNTGCFESLMFSCEGTWKEIWKKEKNATNKNKSHKDWVWYENKLKEWCLYHLQHNNNWDLTLGNANVIINVISV
jgi:predicted metal-binding transcription factor (methanogenesis marker protein 9)